MKKIDAKLVSWYRNAPHLPEKNREWLATNVWWIALIGLVIGAIGALQVVQALYFINPFFVSMYGGGALVGAAYFASNVALGFAVVNLVLSAMAIRPLRARQKQGWTLLFAVLLVSVASTVVGLVLTWSFGNFIMGLLSAAISGYFIYEIRTYFNNASASK